MSIPQTIYEIEKQYPIYLNNGFSLSDFYLNFENHKDLNMRDLSQILIRRLNDDGIIIIRNTALHSASDIDRWANLWGPADMDYTGGTNKRKRIGNIMTVGNEPPHMNVAAHNEMSYSYYDIYPKIFMLGCVAAPQRKGQTIFADNKGLTEDLLKSEVGQKFMHHGVRYYRNYYNKSISQQASTGLHSWQDAFGTQKRQDVENTLKHYDIDMIQWLDNGALRFSYLKPAYEWDDISKENLSFLSTGNHGYWFRNWHPFCDLPNKARPHHLTFGNGEELTEEDLKIITDITIDHSLEHHWQAGDLVVLDNLRFTHGRKPFKLEAGEKREIYVAMRHPTKRQGIKGRTLH